LGGFSWVKRHLRGFRLASAALLIGYGLLILTGQMTWLTRQLAPYQWFDF
jgi:hypothetical protein